MAILSGFLLVVFIISAVLLVIIVLIQEESGEGLGGIFGGGGAAPVGNRQGNILTRTTAILAIVFLSSLFGYAFMNRTPDTANVEAAARQMENQQEGVLNWWETNAADVNLPQDLQNTDATQGSTDTGTPTDGQTSSDGQTPSLSGGSGGAATTTEGSTQAQ